MRAAATPSIHYRFYRKEPIMQSTVFGIDLGTACSNASYIDATGNVVTARSSEGANTTPSVVYFTDNGDTTVGEVAKDLALVEPDRTAQLVKPLMGKDEPAIVVDGVAKSPEEVSSYIIRKVVQDAVQSSGMEMDGVVVTVPAHFGDVERAATKAAAEIAGLNLINLVQEPVAAAVYYGCTKSDADSVVMVYDLGGGTFDASVIAITRNDEGTDIRVVCADGNHNLGGRLWDDQIVNYLADAFVSQTGYEDEFDPYAQQALRNAAEKAKKHLSSKDEDTVALNIAGLPARISLTRETFDQMTSHLLSQTIEITRSTLDNAASKGCVVEKILLVGGSTRMPQVVEALKANFPDIPLEINDPDEAVSKGAALCALDILAGKGAPGEGGVSEKSVVSQLQLTGNAVPLTIHYATTKSYGVQVLDVKTNRDMVCNLIQKNQQITSDDHTYRVERIFGTNVDNQQTVEVRVFENDEELDLIPIDRDPIKTATFDLNGSSLPKNSPIEVAFCLSEEGLLSVTAMEPQSGRNLEFDVQVSSGLSPEEVERIKNDALTVEVQ